MIIEIGQLPDGRWAASCSAIEDAVVYGDTEEDADNKLHDLIEELFPGIELE